MGNRLSRRRKSNHVIRRLRRRSRRRRENLRMGGVVTAESVHLISPIAWRAVSAENAKPIVSNLVHEATRCGDPGALGETGVNHHGERRRARKTDWTHSRLCLADAASVVGSHAGYNHFDASGEASRRGESPFACFLGLLDSVRARRDGDDCAHYIIKPEGFLRPTFRRPGPARPSVGERLPSSPRRAFTPLLAFASW